MEMRRLGLATKPLLTVPNHLTFQMGAEFLRAYPDAKILITRKEDFQKENLYIRQIEVRYILGCKKKD